MENEINGFKAMSAKADEGTGAEGVGETFAAGAKGMADQVSSGLKSVGVDAEGTIEMVEERATNLQDMLIEEIQSRPFRALGWAAAAGLIVGIISAR